MHGAPRRIRVALAVALIGASIWVAPPASAEQTVQWELVRAVWYEVEEGSPFYGVDILRDNLASGRATYAYLHRGICGFDRRGFGCDVTTRVLPIDPDTLTIAPLMSGATVAFRSKGRTYRVSWTADTDRGAWHAYPDVLRADTGGVAAAAGVIRWAHAWGRGFGRRLGNTSYAYLLSEVLLSRSTSSPPQVPPHAFPQR